MGNMKELQKEYLVRARRITRLRKAAGRHPYDEAIGRALRKEEKEIFELVINKSRDLEEFIFYTDGIP